MISVWQVEFEVSARHQVELVSKELTVWGRNGKRDLDWRCRIGIQCLSCE